MQSNEITNAKMNPDSGKHFKLARPLSEARNESFLVSPGASGRYTDPAKCLGKGDAFARQTLLDS